MICWVFSPEKTHSFCDIFGDVLHCLREVGHINKAYICFVNG